MKASNLVLIAGLAAAGIFFAPTLEAKAETRFHLLLPGFPAAPPPRHYYYYPEPYDEEDYAYPYDEDEDYDGYYSYGPDDDYYEPAPRQYSPKPRKKSKTVTVAPNEEYAPAPKIKKKPATTALAAPVKPNTPTKNASVSCDKARSIITGYGFGNIQTKSCVGDVYSFAAVRGGKSFSVKVSALSGELTEVKRQ
jgi:hypothetical protein